MSVCSVVCTGVMLACPAWAAIIDTRMCPNPPTSQGGLSLKTNEIALPTSFAGVGLVLFALFLYPRIQRRIGCLACAKIGLALAVPLGLLICTPSLLVSKGYVRLALTP